MTLLVGILCTDGVVVAADSASSFGAGNQFTITHPTHKIDIIEGEVIVAGTGSVGLGQRFTAKVKDLWRARVLHSLTTSDPGVTAATVISSHVIQDFGATHAPQLSVSSLLDGRQAHPAHG